MPTIVEDYLMHYGVKRRSGRYPWGSGKEPYQHSGDFLSRVEELRSQGMGEKDICETLGMTTTDYRMQYRRARHERRNLLAAKAQSLREDGMSLNEIARELGFTNDSSVRSLLNANTKARKNRAEATAEILKKELEDKGTLDVGAGAELELNVSRQTLQEALFILETEGYSHFGISIGQVTNKGQRTTYELISSDKRPVKEQQRDIYNDPSLIKSVEDYHSTDGGKTFNKREYPASIDSDRIGIRYGDQGGIDKDGVIEIRPGVKDLNLGDAHYAQVRILVDGTHYLKGMAMYSDDLPDGVDIMFNTNKKTGTPKGDVMKPINADDPSNPFGAYIKASGQSYYDDPNGKYTDPVTQKKQSLSAINKLREEGDWDSYSRNLSSQFLSKQPVKFVKSQLDLTYKDYDDQLNDILALTNPTIKRKLLQDFADNCDGAAVHMKAAALPRQTTKVILPVTTLKDNEVYAPTYRDGEQVALIRYPHAGIFEIPILTVNNKNKGAIGTLGRNPKDAIGITPQTAQQLSGADFDGDSVIVIPLSSKVRVNASKPLRELEGFEPKITYSTEGKTGVSLMKKTMVQKQMGMVSNLITDMTLKGAPPGEIAKAVKHSMVVIDAYKHKLDYKQSEIDNDIPTLKKRWQGYTDESGAEKGGASTLLSRRKQVDAVPERKGSPRIDPDTGELIYKTSGRKYVDAKTGELKEATTNVKKILNTKDVHSLSSGTPVEEAYADYANKMKALANRARKEMVSTPRLQRKPDAAKEYATEVESLDAKLRLASRNAPKERQAQVLANSVVKAQTDSNPNMDKKEIRKLSQMALEEARTSVGASSKDVKINITDSEWNAIQAGAISDSKLSQILRYSDTDRVRQLATPRSSNALPQAKINRIRAMQASGFTIAEIADAVGASSSTVSQYLKS